MNRTTFARLGAAGLASIALHPRPARAAQFTVKVAHNWPVDHPGSVRTVQMWNAIKHETNGAIDAQLFPNSQLGGDAAMLSQLRAGAVEFCMLAGGIITLVVPVAGIEGVGFAFKNSAEAVSTFDGPLGAYVRKEALTKNLVLQDTVWDNGMRHVTTSTKPIRAVDDLSGVRLRVPQSKLLIDLFKTLGASPTSITLAEEYTALQTHVADGAENGLQLMLTLHLYEIQKYLSLTNHSWSGYWLFSTTDTWQKFPANVQQAITRNNRKYALLQRHDSEIREASIADRLRRLGLAVNTPPTEPFRARLGPHYARFKSEFGDAAWTLLEQKVGKLG